MGKIIVGDKQNILLSSGEIVKAKDLKTGDTMLGFDHSKKKVVERVLDSVSKSTIPVNLFSTSQGRIALVPLDTIFYGSFKIGYDCVTCFKDDSFDNYSRKNYVQCLFHHKIFGDLELDDKDIADLKSSIFYLNDKRPNQRESLIQTIPRLLSKLKRDCLKKVFKDVNLIRNLDIFSKDLLIVLLNRLGILFIGKSHGRLSKEISGSMHLQDFNCSSCLPVVKEEKLTSLGASDMNTIELNIDSNNLYIGSVLCKMN